MTGGLENPPKKRMTSGRAGGVKNSKSLKGGLWSGARPGGKDLLGKNHEAGQPFEPPMKVFSLCRGDPPVARPARRILRKPVEASRKGASPADAFCPEAPCPRATTQESRKCQPRTQYGAPARVGDLIINVMPSSLCSLAANLHHKRYDIRSGIRSRESRGGFETRPCGRYGGNELLWDVSHPDRLER